MFGRRVEVLFDTDEYARLRGRSSELGVTVAQLVRDAVRQQVLAPVDGIRQRALARLLSGAVALDPPADWSAVEEEIEAHLRRDIEAH